MAKDVVITPASGLIDFKNASGVSVSTIQLADNGNFSVGNTASNLYIGDGTNSVDIIFEQNGKVRALTGKTLTLGQSDSTVNLNAPLTYTSPDGTKTVTSSMLNSGTLSISGSAGQLFSVNNSFTGTTFSVNDVSGIPSIEVLDTGVVKLGQYGGNVLLGTGIDDGVSKLQVNGKITANVYYGNLGNGAANRIVYQTAIDTTSFITAPTTTDTFLKWNGSAFAWATAGGTTITNDTTTNASYYLGMSSATSGSWSTAYVSNSKLYFNPSTGTLSSTIFDSLSDESVKTNISIISDSLSIINKINGVKFNWIDNDKPSAGVIAQQLETVLPALVDTNGDTGLKSVNYSGIIGYLIEAIKELNSEIVQLKKMIK